MPATISDAVLFLETQWPSINQNKVKGILAEVRLKSFLLSSNTYFGPGGWIVVPGKPTGTAIPTMHKVCLIPRTWKFSWQTGGVGPALLSPSEVSAYNYFRQFGVQTYFVDPKGPDESAFIYPGRRTSRKSPATFPRPYDLELKELVPSGELQTIDQEEAFSLFPRRSGQLGLKCNPVGRLNPAGVPWNAADTVSELFWFEYSRFYFQVDYLMSNNDLDMYLIGVSGAAYPVELKSKKVAQSDSIGDWFGIDMGPFAKLAYFTANAMNTDALYIVEEVDVSGKFVDWLAIRYTHLVEVCSWVGQRGGTSMTGGGSSTYRVPKLAFSPLSSMLPTL